MGKKKLPSKRRLKTMDDVRRFLAYVVNQLNRDEMESAKASKLGYLCQILARVIESNDLEARVSVLEKAMNGDR